MILRINLNSKYDINAISRRSSSLTVDQRRTLMKAVTKQPSSIAAAFLGCYIVEFLITTLVSCTRGHSELPMDAYPPQTQFLKIYNKIAPEIATLETPDAHCNPSIL